MVAELTPRLAVTADLAALTALDEHVSAEMMARCVRDRRVLVLEDGQAIVGWLRWGFFWDEIPFMNMLFLLEPVRGQGVGRRLVGVWEQRMLAAGHPAVLTSTLSDEPAQHFYRRLGYVDCGVLLLPGEAAELLLRKDLTATVAAPAADGA